MLKKLLLLFIISMFTYNLKAGETYTPSDYETHLKEVERYIDYFHRHTKLFKKKIRIAKKHIAPLVVKHSLQNNFDPLLISVIISCESTWQPSVVGKLGEIGLMQVMKGKSGIENEIVGGILRLRSAFNHCHEIKKALTHYASGTCNARTERTKRKIEYRIRLYKRAIKNCRQKTTYELISKN